MLQSQTAQLPDETQGEFLSPSQIVEIVKRRALYFLIPFLLVASTGCLLALAWPAKYLATGKILVQSPEIPTNLVRPTVDSLASERIQVIAQRIMTRDNLLAIADKFHITNSWQGWLSGSQIVDFIRDRISIEPVEIKSGNERKQAIAFNVGFEYEQPQIAMYVANELLTMILREDARIRTAYATETTKFIDRDVQRLEAQLSLLDSQIAALNYSRRGSTTLTNADKLDNAKELAALRAQLLLKSATYSNSHPDVIALKRKIEALEKSGVPVAPAKSAQTSDKSDPSSGAQSSPKQDEMGVDTLETKRASLKKELETATEKLAIARLGESLEQGQYSERLEVIEQPTLPTKPVSPKRPKWLAAAIIAALMAGGALAGATEMFDRSIRRSSDLFALIDSHLVVSLPYIATRREILRKKRLIIIASSILAATILATIIALVFILPPLDLLFQKVLSVILRY